MHYLKLFDKTLITFELEMKILLKIYNINIICKNRKIFPELLREKVSSNTYQNSDPFQVKENL